jgi:hypothetical protein
MSKSNDQKASDGETWRSKVSPEAQRIIDKTPSSKSSDEEESGGFLSRLFGKKSNVAFKGKVGW